eukprot:jgi/Botrbrau1/1801/Bobra.0217s0052.1
MTTGRSLLKRSLGTGTGVGPPATCPRSRRVALTVPSVSQGTASRSTRDRYPSEGGAAQGSPTGRGVLAPWGPQTSWPLNGTLASSHRSFSVPSTEDENRKSETGPGFLCFLYGSPQGSLWVQLGGVRECGTRGRQKVQASWASGKPGSTGRQPQTACAAGERRLQPGSANQLRQLGPQAPRHLR